MKSSWSRFRVLGLALALLTPIIGLGARPAGATTATVGSAVFRGTANLPTFPCPPPPPFGTGPCTGSFSGQWAGHIAGANGTNAFDVTWSTLDATAPQVTVSNFQYAEWQCAGGTETILGVAQGTGSAVVNPGQLQGKYQIPGETFARDIIGVQFNFFFQWTRLANAAVLVLPTATMQINVSGMGWRTVITSIPQSGVAEFVPTSESGQGVPSCANPLTNVTGTIAGDLPFAGAF